MAVNTILRTWRLWLRYLRRHPALLTNAPCLLPLWTILLSAISITLLRRASPSLPHAPISLPGSPTALSDASLRAQWSRRHFFFCASPGRAGSMHMRALLRSARGVLAAHEPQPRMNDAVLRDVIVRGRRAETLDARARVKLRAMRAALAGTAPDVGYAETTHMFVKTFADVVLRRVAPNARNVTVVVLHRDVADVVESQARLGWGARNHSGRNVWYYGAKDVHPSEQVLPPALMTKDFGGGARDQLEALLGYNADVAARTKALEETVRREQAVGRLRNVQFAHFHVARAETPLEAQRTASRFLEGLRLRVDPGRLAVLDAQNSNARGDKKDRVESAGLAPSEVRAFVKERLMVEPYRDLFA